MANRQEIKVKTAETKAALIADGWTERKAHFATIRSWETKGQHPALQELANLVEANQTKVVIQRNSAFSTNDIPDFDRDTSVNGVE